MAALIPTSPGTLSSVPLTTNRATPNETVSPMRASSEMSSAGSTTMFAPLCSDGHALSGLLVMRP